MLVDKEWRVGSGEWEMGDEGDKKEELITNAQCPIPYSLLSTPHSLMH